MTSNPVKDSASRPNHLADYVKNVRSINDKFGRIAQGKIEIANSLSRAAAALRSVAVASSSK